MDLFDFMWKENSYMAQFIHEKLREVHTKVEELVENSRISNDFGQATNSEWDLFISNINLAVIN